MAGNMAALTVSELLDGFYLSQTYGIITETFSRSLFRGKGSHTEQYQTEVWSRKFQWNVEIFMLSEYSSRVFNSWWFNHNRGRQFDLPSNRLSIYAALVTVRHSVK